MHVAGDRRAMVALTIVVPPTRGGLSSGGQDGRGDEVCCVLLGRGETSECAVCIMKALPAPMLAGRPPFRRENPILLRRSRVWLSQFLVG